MRRDLRSSLVAMIIFTVLFGLAYPLITTGVARFLFPGKSDGSQIERDGAVVGSELIGQGFTMRVPNSRQGGREFIRVPDPGYFQSRPSVTGYSPDVTFFNNLGPNNRELSQFFQDQIDAYIELEGPFTRGLGPEDVPVDAVTTSASGVDPHISEANALIQANRIAEERGIPLERVQELIDENTDGRALGFLGEPGVNVLNLNLAIDDEVGQ
jgi:potassium-transporting ATPase KdpC subunit